MIRLLSSILLCGAALLLGSCRSSQPSGENVASTMGLDVLRALAEDPQNKVVPILETELKGFREDVSEYRAWAVRRTEAGGTITAKVPEAGTYYPAFIFYDGPGDERIAVFAGGSRIGTAVANLDDNRQRLFFVTKPHTFQGGETIELRALTEDGIYRTEDLLLLKEKPEPRLPVEAISHVEARPSEREASITWITNWPTAGSVEMEGKRFAEDLALNNHRVVVRDLEPGREYRYRVAGRARNGRTINGEWQTFRTAAPPETAGSARNDRVVLRLEQGGTMPVTVGIPFPKGVLGSDRHLRLGGETPLQARVLHRWDDGSVKWVLLDFQAAQPSVELHYGSDITRPAGAPLAAEDAGAVTVDTGRIKFAISKSRFNLFDSVAAAGVQLIAPGNTGGFDLTGPDGQVYSSLTAPDEVAIEENGPVRAVVRVRGQHRNDAGAALFTYDVRVHAWAGQPLVRIAHTFGNNNPAADFTDIQSLVLRVPLAQNGEAWALGGRSGKFQGGAVTLVQRRDDQFAIEPGLATGKRAAGWAEWTSGANTVTLALRDFWQNYPKDLSVKPDGFELALCPKLNPNEYDWAKGTIDEHRLFFYLQNGVYKLPQGITKTHDVWLEFGARSPASVRQQQRPRMAVAPPEWYASSKAFGDLTVPGPDPILRRYDNAFSGSFAGYLGNREVNREYGMLNFGDWWGERVINWGNSEYDTQHGFILQFLRTGNFQYFRTAEEVEWHNRDIDAVHYHSDPMKVGGVYAHAIGHTGGYFDERPTGGAPPGGFTAGSPRSHMAVDHTFIEGHLDYYFLTGDRRSRDTALLTADRYNSYFTRNYDFNNCRQPGWHLILTMAAYDATGDPYYLNAGRIIVERVLERQTPDGGWKRQMVPGHCHCTPRHEGNAGFMVGVLLTGLKRYYASTGDERVADSIVKGARFLIDSMWVPEVHAFRYTSCPRSNPSVTLSFLLLEGIVFAHQRNGDELLRNVLLQSAGRALDTMPGGRDAAQGRDWGKSFTQLIRVTPHYLDALVRLRNETARTQ